MKIQDLSFKNQGEVLLKILKGNTFILENMLLLQDMIGMAVIHD